MLEEHTSADAETNQTIDPSTDAPAAADTAADTPADTPADTAGDPPAVEKPAPRKRAARKTAAKKAAAPAAEQPDDASSADDGVTEPRPAKKAATRRTTRKRATAPAEVAVDAPTDSAPTEAPVEAAPAKRTTKRTAKKSSRARTTEPAPEAAPDATDAAETDPAAAPEAASPEAASPEAGSPEAETTSAPATVPLFQPPPTAAAVDDAAATVDTDDPETAADGEPTSEPGEELEDQSDESADTEGESADGESADGESAEGESATRRRRRRGGRRRRKGGGADSAQAGEPDAKADEQSGKQAGDEDTQGGKKSDKKTEKKSDKSDKSDKGADGSAEDGKGPEGQSGDGESESGSSRRRRRRRRSGDNGDGDGGDSDPENTVTRVRRTRSAEDEITSFSGSTRLEAKKQRRREGREAGRRRAPIISEAEFLARREAVDRAMVIRQRDDLTQIAVLEDNVLVEHYVARESQTSLIGNVYLGRVQNVLPSMEAAFIDIGKGRNAVLYAGEVNWDALGAKDGGQRKIEQVLKPGQSVLVQVSKDPIGHKGARLTSQISLPGRFLVYVPDGTTSGISRKLPENERNRLKNLLKEIVPETAGVIVRTAAEGASEAELTRDVERLKALWDDISAKVESGGSSSAPQLLYGEPDLTLKVVRDLFTEDFARLVVSGDDAWEMVQGYVRHVAPDLVDRLEKHDDDGGDAFAAYRIDEQIAKALDRKVWLPSGGSLIIDRTEAMTVVDVNTGKFTGSGGNLEETVTKNNLEAAEEIVRQLRLRDIGGIIVVDFIDMVLENNRDLVLRRLIECLGRDRTRHQVAEVTSLGLVQMTRKRIGTGLLEAFSEVCECCQGRGLHLRDEPVEAKRKPDEEPRRNRRNRGRGKDEDRDTRPQNGSNGKKEPEPGVRRPTPAEFAAMARADAHRAEKQAESAADPTSEDGPAEQQPAEQQAEQPAEQQAGDQPGDGDRTLPQDAEVPEVDGAAPQPDPAVQAPGSTDPQVEEPPSSVVPAAPRIVTSVRRVGARRAAGPPVPPRDEEPGDAAEEQPHVPVKKKGSRKR